MLTGLKRVFRTSGPVVIYPASGTGAWEAALVNTLSPGDAVVMARTGWFATLWSEMATRLGLEPLILDTDWRRGADPAAIEEALRRDSAHRIRAVCVVHNETSTGCVSPIAAVRAAIDAARHPALLMVDTISSLASIDYRHEDWGVDVTVAGSQKGLMLPPGLSFNAVERAGARRFAQPRSCRAAIGTGGRCSRPTPASIFPIPRRPTCCADLQEALADARGGGPAERLRAPRPARRGDASGGGSVGHGGRVELQCQAPTDYSSSLTAVRLSEGHSADALRALILQRFNMSLGNGLGILKDRVFRIGHLGDFNDLSLIGALSGVEMGLKLAGIPCGGGGVDAAMAVLTDAPGQRLSGP